MMRILICMGLVCLAAACVAFPQNTMGAQNPLRYDVAKVAQADHIAIFVPGALSSSNIFRGTAVWEEAGIARVFYRYPGFDRLPVDHRVTPAAAAAHIADFANAYPDKQITLVGYSTGGPIALLAATQISGKDRVHVAAISTAVEYGGGASTLFRSLRDLAHAANVTGSLTGSDVWKKYWEGLLYGPAALTDPAFADRLARFLPEGAKIPARLDPVIILAHTAALPNWTWPEDADLTGVDVAFFVGLNDSVFSTAQTQAFARKVGDVTIYGYPDDGHLLFLTRPALYTDVLHFAQGQRVAR